MLTSIAESNLNGECDNQLKLVCNCESAQKSATYHLEPEAKGLPYAKSGGWKQRFLICRLCLFESTFGHPIDLLFIGFD